MSANPYADVPKSPLSGEQFCSVFHGTGTTAWSEIQKTGLRPSVLGYTVTTKPRAARMFANDWDNPEAGDAGVVLRADLPSSEFGRYVDEESFAEGEYQLRDTIPPEYLKEYP